MHWKTNVLLLSGFLTTYTMATGLALAATAKAAKEAVGEVNVALTDRGIQPANILARPHHPLHLHVMNRGHQLHQFSIPDFYVYSRTLQPGESSDITFAPYKTGRFHMTSDPTGDKAPEFHGDFVVKEHK